MTECLGTFKKGEEYWEKAPAAGGTRAMRDLGIMYTQGQGVLQDCRKAREWYEKAVAADDAKQELRALPTDCSVRPGPAYPQCKYLVTGFVKVSRANFLIC